MQQGRLNNRGSTRACIGWAQHLALLQPRQAVQQRQLQPLRQARAEPLQGTQAGGQEVRRPRQHRNGQTGCWCTQCSSKHDAGNRPLPSVAQGCACTSPHSPAAATHLDIQLWRGAALRLKEDLQGRAGQGRAGQGRAGQGRSVQGRRGRAGRQADMSSETERALELASQRHLLFRACHPAGRPPSPQPPPPGATPCQQSARSCPQWRGSSGGPWRPPTPHTQASHAGSPAGQRGEEWSGQGAGCELSGSHRSACPAQFPFPGSI